MLAYALEWANLLVRLLHVTAAIACIGPAVAVAISVGLLIIGWLVYDGLSRALEGHDRLLALALAVVISVTAFGVSHLLSPRAAYLQVGAMIGTWMAANVGAVIIP